MDVTNLMIYWLELNRDHLKSLRPALHGMEVPLKKI